MTVSINDINLVYSGGLNNSNPDNSLGGDPSVHSIGNGLNNLFRDTTPEEAELGSITYRAFYIYNENIVSSLFSTQIWVASEVPDGATVTVGVNLVDEVQNITITPQADITGGTFKISISYIVGGSPIFETTDAISWNADFTILAQNIETALNNLNKFSTIDVSSVGGNAIFDVTFQGNDGNTLQPSLTITDNNLTSSGDPAEINVTIVTAGSPINTFAEDIGSETVPPTGIVFTNPDSEASALDVGVLTPTVGFPVWIKRTVDPTTEALSNDGFTLRIQGSSTT